MFFEIYSIFISSHAGCLLEVENGEYNHEYAISLVVEQPSKTIANEIAYLCFLNLKEASRMRKCQFIF